ncbi:hypothetical protein NC796_25755 [Aliifodinibius sp. S!AR15-10]|uniref:hypothetical protein n=1 Tax=Aliifodinibius sp. S!AR15-10 TaxID=2950437 RepID=UPI0028678BF0|nr:hypothetical protein [Aliifodinibius sp. S!AR15-10]MDR8394577.1 hypothetical protein [Aliifodinibius sp. S!AR15-10]
MSPLFKSIGFLFFGLVVGYYFIRLGLRGRHDKIKRESDDSRPLFEALGTYEGAVENGWWILVTMGVVIIVSVIINFINKIG